MTCFIRQFPFIHRSLLTAPHVDSRISSATCRRPRASHRNDAIDRCISIQLFASFITWNLARCLFCKFHLASILLALNRGSSALAAPSADMHLGGEICASCVMVRHCPGVTFTDLIYTYMHMHVYRIYTCI